MRTPESDPIYVRASVSDRCNLDCVYCPKREGMENKVPARLRGSILTTQDYCQNLSRIARNGVEGVSFTGGEPTLNRDLPVLVQHARQVFDRVELTSNGRFLVRMLPDIAPYLDVLKISLDATDARIVQIATNGTSQELSRAVASIRAGCAAGLRVGINVVVRRSLLDQVEKILLLCASINTEGYPGKAYVSLLDFYYSDERRAVWEQEFLPTDELESELTNRYGLPIAHERFGCRFMWFDANGVEVRLKDSYGATHRADKCTSCKTYCQEGIYGLKHSIEGWITTCPSNAEELGVHLHSSLGEDAADAAIRTILDDIHSAKPTENSFSRMLQLRQLTPLAVQLRRTSVEDVADAPE
jgi:molybdenum cofactor biosynthesis enzyme MoaA